MLNMLNIIDEINNSGTLNWDSLLVSFDVVNMYPSINNVSGLKAVYDILNKRVEKPLVAHLNCISLYLQTHFSLLIETR